MAEDYTSGLNILLGNQASNQVQPGSPEQDLQNLYEQGGKEFEITQLYKPRINRILEAEWKNFLEANNIRKGSQQYQDVVDEVLMGKRGIYDMVREYDIKRGVPLSGHIGSRMQKRGVSEQVFKIVPDTQGMYKQEIDAQTKKIADEVIEDVVEAKKDLLKETINLDPSMLNEVVNAVIKTFGLDLGDIKSRRIFEDQSRNYQQAQGAAMGSFADQQRRALGAGQGLGQLGLGQASVGKTMAGLGALGSQLGQADIQSLLGIGGMKQQLGQAQLEAGRQQQLMAQREPFTRLGFASDILRGVPSGQISYTQQPQTNP